MAAEERVRETDLAKSLSRVSRVVCETLSRSDSQHKPADARSKGKKGQHRSGNEIAACFAPVSRPLLSPGRDKVREAGRRKAHSGPIFALPPQGKRGKKQSYEIEEPTSPKVTCIGQVRSNKNTDEGLWHEERQRRFQQSKAGSASPGRFFASPGRQAKWGSLFGSRKDSVSSPRAGYGADVSCFGLPYDPPTMVPSYRDGKSCGAFLAKSLMLLQESDSGSQSRREQSYAQNNSTFKETLQLDPYVFAREDSNNGRGDEVAAAYEPPANALLLTRRKFSSLKVGVPSNSLSSFLKRSTSAASRSRTKKEGNADYEQLDTVPVSETAKVSSNGSFEGEDEPPLQQEWQSHFAPNVEQDRSVDRPSTAIQKQETLEGVSVAMSVEVGEESIPQASTDGTVHESCVPEEEKPKALPAPPPPSPNAVLLRRCDWETLKISFDVVPETWLWENGGTVLPDVEEEGHCDASRSSRIMDGISKVRVQGLHGEQGYESYHDEATQASASDRTGCAVGYSFHSRSTEYPEYQIPVRTAARFHVKGVREDCNREFKISNRQKENPFEPPSRNLNEKQDKVLDDVKCADLLSNEKECINMDKPKYLLAFADLDEGCVQCGVEISGSLPKKMELEKQDYVLALSELGDDDLHRIDPQRNVMDEVKRMCKEKKSEGSRPQSPPNSIILLKYRLEALSLSLSNDKCKLLDGEKVQKRDMQTRLEVGRLSFQGIGTYSQWFKGGTEFIHSYSPISNQTVIRLKRCNSEPCRSSS